MDEVINLNLMRWNLDYVQGINRRVADHLFPNRTFNSMMLKAYGELAEMVDSPDSPEECADLLIMLLDHMDRLGANAGAEIGKKLMKNLEREWAENPHTGVFQHKE